MTNSRTQKFIQTLNDSEADKLLVDLLERRPMNELLIAKNQRTQLTHIGEYVEEAQEYIKNWGKMQGLSCGIDTIDYMTMGLVPGELTILSGIESHGKTQLAINMGYNIARQNKPVLFVSLEMTKAQITSRMMKMDEQYDVSNMPLFYQLEIALDYRDVGGLVKQGVSNGAELVIVDHLHMMPRGAENQAGEIGKIVAEFKKAAIKNNVPIVLLCQLRRINDKIDNKRREPEMQDLKESSYISQDADIVLLLHRNIEDQEANNDEITVVLHKNRNRGVFKETRRTMLISNGVKLEIPSITVGAPVFPVN